MDIGKKIKNWWAAIDLDWWAASVFANFVPLVAATLISIGNNIGNAGPCSDLGTISKDSVETLAASGEVMMCAVLILTFPVIQLINGAFSEKSQTGKLLGYIVVGFCIIESICYGSMRTNPWPPEGAQSFSWIALFASIFLARLSKTLSKGA